MVQEKGALVITMTMINAKKEKNRFIRLDKTFEIGNIYFGRLTFFINEPALRI